jgi:hypothetical protein
LLRPSPCSWYGSTSSCAPVCATLCART